MASGHGSLPIKRFDRPEGWSKVSGPAPLPATERRCLASPRSRPRRAGRPRLRRRARNSRHRPCAGCSGRAISPLFQRGPARRGRHGPYSGRPGRATLPDFQTPAESRSRSGHSEAETGLAVYPAPPPLWLAPRPVGPGQPAHRKGLGGSLVSWSVRVSGWVASVSTVTMLSGPCSPRFSPV